MDPIVNDLLDMMPDTIQVESHPGTWDGMGATVGNYGDPVSYPCRIIGTTTMIRDVDGRERTSSVHAIIGGYYAITIHDRFTLPSRFLQRSPKVLSVATHTDENGTHHQTVYFE